MTTKYDGKNLEIQFLRLIAILLVALTHFRALNSPFDQEWGMRLHTYIKPWIGVDVFLVISGYLMGKILLERTADVSDQASAIRETVKFWKARFLRLFPAAAFWITMMWLAGMISGNRELWAAPHELFQKWAASILSIRNFENAVQESHLGWYWSLSLENQFYLLLPLVWFALPRKYFWPLICVLTLVWSTYGVGGNQWFWFRCTGLFWGMLVYKLTSTPENRHALLEFVPKWGPLTSLCVVGGVLVLTGAANTALAPQYGNFSATVACVVTAFIMVFASLNAGFIRIPRFLNSVVYWGGELAYSFYLCHFTIWLIIQDIARRNSWDVPSPVMIAGGVAITLAASYLSYMYIERPFYRTKGIKPTVSSVEQIATQARSA